MRRRSVQLSILIVIILGLSVASLAYRDININVPGFPALVRGGDGPLGLKLGLDLSGGGHLVYQADTGTRIEVGFADPTRGVVVENALDGLGVTGYEIRPPGRPHLHCHHRPAGRRRKGRPGRGYHCYAYRVQV